MNKWNDLKSFFEDLNENCKYVILRNWESLENEDPYVKGHEDIDLLCEDIEAFMRFSGAQKVHVLETRNNYTVSIGDNAVRFDVRFVGDGYYDSKWESQMLSKRTKEKFYYIMDSGEFAYSLAYHALIHKMNLSEDYHELLKKTVGNENADEKCILNYVKEYCESKGYQSTIPLDPGVVYNIKNAKYIRKEHSCLKHLKRLMFRLKLKLRMNV